MGMEAADSMRAPRARNASFDHARRYAVIAGFGKLISEETKKWGKVIVAANIKYSIIVPIYGHSLRAPGAGGPAGGGKLIR